MSNPSPLPSQPSNPVNITINAAPSAPDPRYAEIYGDGWPQDLPIPAAVLKLYGIQVASLDEILSRAKPLQTAQDVHDLQAAMEAEHQANGITAQLINAAGILAKVVSGGLAK